MEYVSFLLKIKPDDYEEYVLRHQAVDPELEEQFKQVGIHAYHIYYHEGVLFAHMVVEDFARAMAHLDTHPVNVKWQAFMSDLLLNWEQGGTVKVLEPVYKFLSFPVI